MQRDELSYCRICAAACGIVVSVEGDRVLRVRGDDQHPVSRGYTCSKGRGLAAWHHASDRLDRPRVRGREATWDALLTDLGGRLDSIIAESGPDAIALYLATGLAYDAAGQIAASQWLPAIGSRSFLTAVTVDNAPVLVAAELVGGDPMLNPVWDPTVPGLAIFVGTNPVVSHGYGTALPDPVRRVRDYRAGGGRVWVLDPRRTETAALADVHVPVRPGADVAVLGALANALLEEGADEHELREHCDPAELRALRTVLAQFTIERAATAADVDVSLLEQLVAAMRGAAAASRCTAAPASRCRATVSSRSGSDGLCSSRRAHSIARPACTSIGVKSVHFAGATQHPRPRRGQRVGRNFRGWSGKSRPSRSPTKSSAETSGR